MKKYVVICYSVHEKEIAENDSWFSDNPDVIEVDDLI